MIRVTATLAVMTWLAAPSADAQSLIITRAGSRPVRPAPAQNFTGSAQVEMLFEAVNPSDASGGTVTFGPGARTAWHAHPRGQILIVTAGVGRVQRWGDPIEEVGAGDVVRVPAGQKHWHGASPYASMTHIAISEQQDGATVQWMEPVSEDQYNARDLDFRRRRDAVDAGSAPLRAATSVIERTASRCAAVGTAAAEARARHGGAHRRRAVRRRVEAARAVASRSQPGHHLGVDCDGQDGAAGGPSGSCAGQRCTARRGVGSAGPPGCLLRLAQCGRSARGLRSGVHGAQDRHRERFVRRPATASSGLGRGTRPARRTEASGPSRRSSSSSPTTWCSSDLWRRSDLSVREIAVWSPSSRSPRWATTSNSRSTCAGGSERSDPRADRRGGDPLWRSTPAGAGRRRR